MIHVIGTHPRAWHRGDRRARRDSAWLPHSRSRVIGMGALLLNGAEIGEDSIVAAGTLVPEGKTFPPALCSWASGGVQARATDEEVASIRDYAMRYVATVKTTVDDTQPARGMRDFLPRSASP